MYNFIKHSGSRTFQIKSLFSRRSSWFLIHTCNTQFLFFIYYGQKVRGKGEKKYFIKLAHQKSTPPPPMSVPRDINFKDLTLLISASVQSSCSSVNGSVIILCMSCCLFPPPSLYISYLSEHSSPDQIF